MQLEMAGSAFSGGASVLAEVPARKPGARCSPATRKGPAPKRHVRETSGLDRGRCAPCRSRGVTVGKSGVTSGLHGESSGTDGALDGIPGTLTVSMGQIPKESGVFRAKRARCTDYPDGARAMRALRSAVRFQNEARRR